MGNFGSGGYTPWSKEKVSIVQGDGYYKVVFLYSLSYMHFQGRFFEGVWIFGSFFFFYITYSWCYCLGFYFEAGSEGCRLLVYTLFRSFFPVWHRGGGWGLLIARRPRDDRVRSFFGFVYCSGICMV